MENIERKGPLAGVRILELAHMYPGPIGGLLLADMGADVIKVERPPGGDETRHNSPASVNGESASFMVVNRNKRGIVLDLKQAAGVDVLKRLVLRSDALLENFRPGTLEKLGLGYDDLKLLNPALVYCKLTGFGIDGPYARRPGYDLILQGMSGLMGVTGEGRDRPPVKVGVPVGDVTAGILAATAILAAYIERLRTGQGQFVDTSLLEASVIHSYWPAAMAFATGVSQQPMGSSHPATAPHQAFPTADGWVNICAVTASNWERIPVVLGLPELLQDPRFASNGERFAHREALAHAMSAVLRTRETQHWIESFEAAGVPAGPILNVKQVFEDPQVRARDMVIAVDHETAGTVAAVGCPVKFSSGSGVSRRGAPVYGQHTTEVLAEIGYSPAEIAGLVREGAAHVAHGRHD